VLIVIAYYSAYRLRFEQSYAQHEQWFVISLPIALAAQLMAFALFRVYQGVWRYTSLPDLIRLRKATMVGTGGAELALVPLYRFEGYSRSVFIMDAILLLMFVGTSRLSFRIFDELLRTTPLGSRRVPIYGAGNAGDLVLRELRSNPRCGRTVTGFLDDNRWKQHTLLHGVPVFGGLERLEAILDDQRIDEVIVSSEKISQDRLELIAEVCERRGVRLTRDWRNERAVIAS
jgi:UDP-GlcNAc:undecaprenyl-phosphate GlcNAc-1-phosphate transferase